MKVYERWIHMAKEQVASILRALQILECFVDAHTEWTLKALVAELNLPSTTVFRQVSTLVERQYLTQDPVRKSYQVGPRFLLLSSGIMGQSDLRSTAQPILQRLSDELSETINLSILVDRDIFYLDKVETHRSVACNTRVGSRAPAYATSGGKAMLAHRPQHEIDSYCQWLDINATALTDHTIVDSTIFRQALIDTKVMGYAIDDNEVESGLICIGAPIYDRVGKVIAAVSVAGPAYRMEQEREIMIRHICQASKEISYLLGASQQLT